MARTSKKSQQSQNSIDLSKAETQAVGSFMKRLQLAGMGDITLCGMGDIRRLYRCLSVMRSNVLKHLNGELSHEELVEEHNRSFSYWSGEANNDFDSFA